MIWVGMIIASSFKELTVLSWNVFSPTLRGGPFEYVPDPGTLDVDQMLLYELVRDEVYKLFGDFKTYESSTEGEELQGYSGREKKGRTSFEEPKTIKDILDEQVPDKKKMPDLFKERSEKRSGSFQYRDFIFPEGDHLDVAGKGDLFRGEKTDFRREGIYVPQREENEIDFKEIGKGYNGKAEEFEFLDWPIHKRLEYWETLTPKEWALADRKVYDNKKVKELALNRATKNIPKRLLNQWLEPSAVFSEAPKKIEGKNARDLLALRLYDVIMIYARYKAFTRFDEGRQGVTAAKIWEKMLESYSGTTDWDAEVREMISVVNNFKPDVVLLQEIDEKLLKESAWKNSVGVKYEVFDQAAGGGNDNSVVLIRKDGELRSHTCTLEARKAREVVVNCKHENMNLRIGSLHLGKARKNQNLQEHFKESVFSLKMEKETDITIVGGDLNVDIEEKEIKLPPGWVLPIVDYTKLGLATTAKQRSQLQPQMPKREKKIREMLDNVFVAGNVQFVDVKTIGNAPKQLINRFYTRDADYAVFGLLPKSMEDVTLPNTKLFDHFGRSDHLPVVFRLLTKSDSEQKYDEEYFARKSYEDALAGDEKRNEDNVFKEKPQMSVITAEGRNLGFTEV